MFPHISGVHHAYCDIHKYTVTNVRIQCYAACQRRGRTRWVKWRAKSRHRSGAERRLQLSFQMCTTLPEECLRRCRILEWVKGLCRTSYMPSWMRLAADNCSRGAGLRTAFIHGADHIPIGWGPERDSHGIRCRATSRSIDNRALKRDWKRTKILRANSGKTPMTSRWIIVPVFRLEGGAH